MRHTEDLLQKYPELLQNAFDISHPPGWAQLVDNLCAELYVLIRYNPNLTPDTVYVQQIKQKFGGLRCYMSQETAAMGKAIQAAEELSERTCEVCGQLGVLSHASATPFYMQVLCEEHQK